MSKIVDDLRIVSEQLLSPPAVLKQALPLSSAGSDFIQKSRQEIADIVHGRDPRLLVITGPCSIHDPVARCVKRCLDEPPNNLHRDRLYLISDRHIHEYDICRKSLVADRE